MNLKIVGLDVRPYAHETAQTRNLRLTHKLSKCGRKIYKVNQVGKLLWIISDRLLHSLWQHYHNLPFSNSKPIKKHISKFSTVKLFFLQLNCGGFSMLLAPATVPYYM